MIDIFAADSFLLKPLLMGVLSSIVLGFTGTFVVVRRTTYISAALSHCIIGGIGAGLYARHVWGWGWVDPRLGALVVVLLASWLITYLRLRTREREDSIIIAIWCAGMAIGLLLLYKVPAYVDPMVYLFGDILLVSDSDLVFAFILDVFVVLIGIKFWPLLFSVSFDEEHARLKGLPVARIHFVLQTVVALTVVLLVPLVGAILVIALISLPAAIAGRFTMRLAPMAILATVIAAVASVLGILISYRTDLPTGPMIVFVTAFAYLIIAIVAGKSNTNG